MVVTKMMFVLVAYVKSCLSKKIFFTMLLGEKV